MESRPGCTKLDCLVEPNVEGLPGSSDRCWLAWLRRRRAVFWLIRAVTPKHLAPGLTCRAAARANRSPGHRQCHGRHARAACGRVDRTPGGAAGKFAGRDPLEVARSQHSDRYDSLLRWARFYVAASICRKNANCVTAAGAIPRNSGAMWIRPPNGTSCARQQ